MEKSRKELENGKIYVVFYEGVWDDWEKLTGNWIGLSCIWQVRDGLQVRLMTNRENQKALL